MHLDELLKYAHDTRRRDRRSDLDGKALAIGFVDDVKRAKRPAAIKPVVHEIQSPHVVEHHGRSHRLPESRRHVQIPTDPEH